MSENENQDWKYPAYGRVSARFLPENERIIPENGRILLDISLEEPWFRGTVPPFRGSSGRLLIHNDCPIPREAYRIDSTVAGPVSTSIHNSCLSLTRRRAKGSGDLRSQLNNVFSLHISLDGNVSILENYRFPRPTKSIAHSSDVETVSFTRTVVVKQRRAVCGNTGPRKPLKTTLKRRRRMSVDRYGSSYGSSHGSSYSSLHASRRSRSFEVSTSLKSLSKIVRRE